MRVGADDSSRVMRPRSEPEWKLERGQNMLYADLEMYDFWDVIIFDSEYMQDGGMTRSS